MQCSKCGTENAATAKFCAECGTPAGVPCPDCRAHNAEDARFCGGCGSRLTPAMAAGGGERRQLTVLFVDLVGSSALSDSLDPEDLLDLLQEYRAAAGDAIKRYDGHVAQYQGDGISAYFGYPVAHEDAAVRALRAGLDLLEAAAKIEVHGKRPRLRIGVHTGLVVMADVRGERLAMGEVPSIASRLEGEADTDTMFISDATRPLVAGQFELDARGSRTLKGVSYPLEVFHVLGRSGATSRFAAKTAGGLAPFVGRGPEVKAIQAAWKDAVAGSGRTILLRGEAGIGKSRLLGATREGTRVRLHEVFEAECSPYEGSHALHPIAQMLARRLGLDETDTPVDKLELLEQFAAGRGVPLEEALPLLAELLSIPVGERYPALDMPPPRKRQRTLEILADILTHCPGGAPVLVLIEDLHWADPSTLELVQTLVAREESAPLLMVCTTRPELTVTWPPAPHWRQIEIGALPKNDTRALVAGVTGGKPLPDDVTRQIIERTGGVPLFVEAVTRTILETGSLRELDDRYELTKPLSPDLIPATVHDSLMARIDRLGSDRPVAQLASAIGRQFNFDLLHHVAGMDTGALANALRRLVDFDLVWESSVEPTSTYMFKHALIQDAAYKSLLRTTRSEYHGRIADALVTQFPETQEGDPALLAHHFEGAGKVNEAIECWMKAGLQAQHASAELECIANLRKAIALLETLPADDPKRLEQETAAQLAIAPALMATRGWGASVVEVACLRARELCEQTGNGEGLFTALWGLWTVLFVRGEHQRALEASERVLEMALAGDNHITHVAAHHAVGYTHYFLGNFHGAREHGEAGLALYDLEQERALVRVFQIPSSVCCAAFLSPSLLFMGYPEQARTRYDQLMQILEDLAIPACTALGLGIGMYYLYEMHDVEAIARLAEEAFEISTAEGFLFWSTTMRVYRGWAQCLLTESDAGMAEMHAGLEGFLQIESGVFVPQMWLMIAEGHCAAGQLDEALEAITKGLGVVEEHDERNYESHLRRLQGEIEIQQGAAEAGEATLRRSIAVAGSQDAPFLELRAALPLTRLLEEQGRGDEGRTLLQPLYDGFSEGHDARELKEARELLDALRV